MAGGAREYGPRAGTRRQAQDAARISIFVEFWQALALTRGAPKVGMVAEATCISKPWTIIPMVVTHVQDYIAAGQFRAGEQLIEARQVVAFAIHCKTACMSSPPSS